MIKVFIEDFVTEHSSESWRDVLENISDYCHAVSTDIGIYTRSGNYMHVTDESLTLPNIVYIEYLYISHEAENLGIIFPDLTKVYELASSTDTVSFGKIKEIDYLDIGDIYMPRISLGNDMYRFTNKETGEQWDIKINEI